MKNSGNSRGNELLDRLRLGRCRLGRCRLGSLRIAALAMVFALSLGACMPIKVNEGMFLRPTPDAQPLGSHAALAAAVELAPGYVARAISVDRGDAVLQGVWLHRGAPNAQPRITAIYFMGNAQRLSRSLQGLADTLLPFDVDLLVFDHRGNGLSNGTPTIVLLEADARAIYDHAVGTLGIAPRRIVGHGFSLGSLIVGGLALDRPLAGLVLDGTGSTAQDYVRYGIPWYAKPFVRVEYDPSIEGKGNLRVVQVYRGPLLILSGQRDATANWRMSRRLFDAARSGEKQWVLAPDQGHGGVFLTAPAQAAYRQLLAQVQTNAAVQAVAASPASNAR